MKLQIDQQTLRWRIDEAELAQLLSTRRLSSVTQLGESAHFTLQLRCIEGKQARLHHSGDQWTLDLPLTALQAHSARLPTRDALLVPLADRADLELRFEVDVRDSLRLRGASRKPRQVTTPHE